MTNTVIIIILLSDVGETSQFWKELSGFLTTTLAEGVEIVWDYYLSL